MRSFLCRKNGSITIFMCFLLISIITFSNSFMESARYYSLTRTFKELDENAAFSVLSKYDRDLYKNYGLLAIQGDVDEEALKYYLNQNLSSVSDFQDANGIDSMLRVGDVQMDKLFPLSQKEVLQAQILEFTAFRGPVAMVNEQLNLEDAMEELVKRLKEMVPFYESLENVASAGKTALDAEKTLLDLAEKTGKVIENVTAYEDAIDSYNEAVSARDSYISEHDESTSDSETDDGTTTDTYDENYEEKLRQLEDGVESAAATVRGKIALLQSSLTSHKEAYDSFTEALIAMYGLDIDAKLEKSKEEAKNVKDENKKQQLEDMAKTAKENYEAAEELANMVSDTFSKFDAFFYSNADADLSSQSALLSGSGSTMGSISPSIYINKAVMAGVAIGEIEEIHAKVLIEYERLDEGYGEISKIVKDMVKLYQMANDNIKHDPFLNNTITSIYNDKLEAINNSYEEKDAKLVQLQLDKTKEVADYLDYDYNYLEYGEGSVENAILYQAMQRFEDAATGFFGVCNNLESDLDTDGILTAIGNAIAALVEFIASILELIDVFIECLTANIKRFLYQNILTGMYCNKMFTNRTTDVEEETRLNGSAFQDNSTPLKTETDCFDKADAEYIMFGNASEKENQEAVYLAMLAFRFLANIPAVATDSILRTFLSIPVIGWVIYLVAYFILVYIEAALDMLFLVYGTDGVDIIKVDGYLSLDFSGAEEFLEKTLNMFESIDFEDVAGSKKTKKTMKELAEDHVEGLFQWDYTDHMLILMTLFTSKDKMYARSADLIELQMRKDTGNESYSLSEMATYIRVENEATYAPLLPIPTIPGLNEDGIKMKRMFYSGY